MAKRDGTGPMGMGTMTGRGMGFCNTQPAGTRNDYGFGRCLVRGLEKGLGRGARFYNNNFAINHENQRDLLIEEKSIIENQLKQINNQLDTLQKDK